MLRRQWVLAVLFMAGLGVSPVLAHPGHSGYGFSGGAIHPLTGADHIIAMVAVGLWAAQLGGRAMWLLPSAFAGFMAVGAVFARIGVGVPFVETGIATSILFLGFMIAISLRLPLVVSAACVGLFALCHGYAHGAEIVAGGSWLSYVAGFTLMTIILHAIGMGIHTMTRLWASEIPVRVAGGLIAAAGIMLVSGL